MSLCVCVCVYNNTYTAFGLIVGASGIISLVDCSHLEMCYLKLSKPPTLRPESKMVHIVH